MKHRRHTYLGDLERRSERAKSAVIFIVLLLLGLAAVLAVSKDNPSHNAHGGYIPACRELPGTLGDDC